MFIHSWRSYVCVSVCMDMIVEKKRKSRKTYCKSLAKSGDMWYYTLRTRRHCHQGRSSDLVPHNSASWSQKKKKKCCRMIHSWRNFPWVQGYAKGYFHPCYYSHLQTCRILCQRKTWGEISIQSLREILQANTCTLCRMVTSAVEMWGILSFVGNLKWWTGSCGFQRMYENPLEGILFQHLHGSPADTEREREHSRWEQNTKKMVNGYSMLDPMNSKAFLIQYYR